MSEFSSCTVNFTGRKRWGTSSTRHLSLVQSKHKTATNGAVLAGADVLPVLHIFYSAHIEILKADCLKQIIPTSKRLSLPSLALIPPATPPTTACVGHDF